MKHAGEGLSLSVRLPANPRSAEALLDECRALGAHRLRIELPLAQAADDVARDRCQHLLERAAASFAVIAAFCRPAAETPAAASDGAEYRAAVIRLAGAVGAHCQWYELADPLGPPSWPDLSADSARLLNDLVDWIGTPVALGGLPLDTDWLARAWDAGVLEPFGALGFAAGVDPLSAEDGGALAAARAICRRQALWLTPAGPGLEERPSIQREAGEKPPRHEPMLARTAEWLGAENAERFLPLDDRWPGGALTRRLLRDGGVPRVRHVAAQVARARPEPGYDLVTGGAGFVGSNLAHRLARHGRTVVLLDSLARAGTEENLDWLRSEFPERVHFICADVRDHDAVASAVAGAARVFHLAAQVAVTTSLADPVEDHAVNATGTLNLLEALRRRSTPTPLIMTSTNKVYGDLDGLALRRGPDGYGPADEGVRARGIDERMPLALASPYGCSKGAADQYVLDYAHSFELPTAVFRMSCIYGPRQFGNEDQGWVAHFVRQTLRGEPITIYGDGHQVRDLLFVDDLIDALLAAAERLPALAGQAFNVGGGAGRAVSLLGLLGQLEQLHGSLPPVRMEDWRAGDQRYYASDTGRLREVTGWSPRVEVPDGLRRLYEWMRAREAGGADAPAAGAPDRRMAL